VINTQKKYGGLTMKWLGLLTLVVLVGACGRDNKNDQNQVAQVPAYDGQNCVQYGGVNCQYGSYPPGWQAYPMNNGYYAGYNNCGYQQSCGYSYSNPYTYNSYAYFSACPYGTVAAYSSHYGLGCVQVYQQSYLSYYYHQPQVWAYYSYGGYYALQYCTVTATSCGVGTVCRSTTGAAWGFCSYSY
jgi:hypothetical protein